MSMSNGLQRDYHNTESSSEYDIPTSNGHDDTIPKPHHEKITRMASLTRNLSEMSIECSTTPPAVAPSFSEKEPLVLDDMDRLSTSNKLVIEEKVKSVFELPDSETLVGEFPCYLIRLVTIPGWMYITDHHICFYASLPGKKKGPYKAGYLSKKNHITSPRTYRYYFELQNHVLSWYNSAESKHLPLNSIDLQHITKIEPSKLKKYGIRLSTSESQHYTIIADSELSQKEWMDELRKSVFVAQHTGNSVRIVLPFSKVIDVEKPSVFQFAANIKIKFMDDMMTDGEDYYFAFFPDIETAYNEIISTWKNNTAEKIRYLSMPATKPNTNNTSFLSFDSFLDNMSPAALPTMLMGKLMNVTGLFGNGNTAGPTSDNNITGGTDEEELSSDDNDVDTNTNTQFTNKNDNLLEATTRDTTKKGNSLFFNKSPEPSIATESSTTDEDISEESSVTANAEDPTPLKSTRPRSGTLNNLTKIPRAVTDAIKHLRTDEQPEIQQPEPQLGRNRSTSLSTLRRHMSPLYLYNKINKETETTTSLPIAHTALVPKSSGDVSLISSSTTPLPQTTAVVPKTRKQRATSISSMLLLSGSKKWHKSTPELQMDENQHRYSKGPMWLNIKLARELKEVLEDEREFNRHHEDSNSDEASDEIPESLEINAERFRERDPHVFKEEQQTMNEQLNANFPMLLKTEVVEAVFKASFWRTIPYSGKIYITDRYFCFKSKILAGQQKLIVPWSDVIQINKLRSKSYYLVHGISMIVKNTTDEIYFDFSSVILRDDCFAVCQLKCDNKILIDNSSYMSKKSRNDAYSMSNVILDRPEHLEPPNEYDGPPLLSSATHAIYSSKHGPPEKSLHFTCLTIGSRGDVQPYVSLCKELQKDGHKCRIATHPEYEDWVTKHGIEFRSVGGDPGELMKLCIDNSFLSVSFIREGTKFFYSWFESLLQSSYEACQGTDVIIESPSAMIGVHMAEKLQVPYFRSMPFPYSKTAKFPHPFAMQSTAGGRIYNDMTYVMIEMALWAGTSRYVNKFRREMLSLPATNLDRLQLWKVPYIYSFSPTVVHPPKDWPDYIHCTGYWFLDNPDKSWQPHPTLVKFLEPSKRPIVYIGFGSIIVPDATETTKLIIEAVLQADVKAIICKGWSTRATADSKQAKDDTATELLDDYPDTIYQLDSVPHDWLFPQIQGVVHHGGAGTTAAGLRAGLPTVVKPFFGDQRFWGQRMEELGVGLCITRLTNQQLSDALITITQNQIMIVKAQAIGETIRKENGPRNAVDSIYRELEYAKEQRLNAL